MCSKLCEGRDIEDVVIHLFIEKVEVSGPFLIGRYKRLCVLVLNPETWGRDLGSVLTLLHINYVFLSKTLTSQTIVSLSTVNHNTYLASLVDYCDYQVRLVNSTHEIFFELQLYICWVPGTQINKILA